MSSRKRPLSEISQSHASVTPSRYAPSTPHAIRALQERSSAKRSARSARSVNRNFRNSHAALDLIRPDGSARNILKQFAKITAPVTKKRISTPTHVDQNKENTNPDGEDDSFMARKPHLTFSIEDSIEEEDSELPVAPTPSALLNEDSDDDDMEQPTITFQNIETARELRAMSERLDRRKSRVSMLGAEEDESEEDERDGDATIMTERGRRALSEEATGRLSRYSFGSIRMSEFGSELEIRRESNRQEKLAALDAENDYVIHGQDDTMQLYGDNTMTRMPHSPTGQLDDSVHFPDLGDDTFNLQVPDDQPTLQSTSAAHDFGQSAAFLANITHLDSRNNDEHESNVDRDLNNTSSRKQTQLETAATKSQKSRGSREKLTRHGIAVPSLPSSLVKRIATEVQVKQGKKKPKFGRDHLKALEQATEWFFEQVGEDLAAYSSHGRRKRRIDTKDALLLMKRQRVLRVNGDLEKLAADWLPQEILDDLELSEES